MPDIENNKLTVVEQLREYNKIELLEPFTGTKFHHKMKCMVCGHEWTATPLSKTQTYKKYGVGGCPECNNKRKLDRYQDGRDRRLQELKDRGILVLDPNYTGQFGFNNDNSIKIRVKNINCGHEFDITPCNLMTAKVECSVCGPSKRGNKLTNFNKPKYEKWRKTASEWQIYKSDVYSLTRAAYKKYANIINPTNLPRGVAGVEGAYHLDHIVSVRFCFDHNIPASVCADVSNLHMMDWRSNIGMRSSIKGAIPTIFKPYISEYAVINSFREKLQQDLQCDTLCVLNQLVVDLYDAPSNVAVILVSIQQINANHKNLHRTRKTLVDAGVRPIFVYEDELISKYDIVVNKIRHYMSKRTEIPRIHARECTIARIQQHEKTEFLNRNHIQGNDRSIITYGAFFRNELVAVMTFNHSRVGMGNGIIQDGVFEITRFVTDMSYNIPGIASKLLKHFQRNHKWTMLYSFMDACWGDGNVYKSLGFAQDRINPPDYFYVIDGVRKHRWNYRKDILKTKLANYDPSLTEYQNMENHGYWRVWDCGTIKYTMTRND